MSLALNNWALKNNKKKFMYLRIRSAMVLKELFGLRVLNILESAGQSQSMVNILKFQTLFFYIFIWPKFCILCSFFQIVEWQTV